jgi:hypothetical protein
VSPATDGFQALQHQLVFIHAPHWEVQGVANAAWWLSKQGLLIRNAAVHQEAPRGSSTVAAMDPQNIASTMSAFANVELNLGKAEMATVGAVLRATQAGKSGMYQHAG